MNDQGYLTNFQHDYERFREEVQKGKRSQGAIIVGSAHDAEALYRWFRSICLEYGNLDVDTRHEVLDAFNDADLLWQLNAMPYRNWSIGLSDAGLS